MARDRNENIQLQNAQNVETQAIISAPNPTHVPITNATDLSGTNGVRTVVLDGHASNRNEVIDSVNNIGGKQDHV